MEISRHIQRVSLYAVFGVVLLLIGCTTTPLPKQCLIDDDEVSRVQTRAEIGDPEAQYQVAKWHQIGSCLSHDNQAYKHWLTQAAEQDYTKAQVNLAAYYRFDENNLDEAILLYKKAAQKGEIEAQRSLGNIFSQGDENTKDLDAAERWYSMAKDQGDEFSSDALEEILKEKNPAKWEEGQLQLASKLELDERAKLQQLILSAEQGNPEAQYKLGKIFESGTDQTEQNLTSAKMWFQRSADQGYAKAIYAVSWISEVIDNPPSLIGIWRGKLGEVSNNEFINITLNIEVKEGKKYTGHVLQFQEEKIRRTHGIRCKDAKFELSQESQTRYEIEISGSRSCNGKGFIMIDSWAGQLKSGNYNENIGRGSISFKSRKNSTFRFSFMFLDRAYSNEYPQGWPNLAVNNDIENSIEGSYKCHGTSSVFFLSNIVTYSEYPPDCEHLIIFRDKNDLVLKLIDNQGKEVYQKVLKKELDYVVKDGWLKLEPNPFFRIDTYSMVRFKATNYFSVTTDGHLVSKLDASAAGLLVVIPYYESHTYWGLFQRIE